MAKKRFIPTSQSLMKTIGTGVKAGLVGGLPSGIIMAITKSPFWGEIIGSTIGASIGQTSGMLTPSQAEIIVIGGYKDAIESLFL